MINSKNEVSHQGIKYKTQLFKSFRMPVSQSGELLKAAADCHYDGVELTGVRDLTSEESVLLARQAESIGLKIHALSHGWSFLNDFEKAERDLSDIKKSLRNARLCGADAILLVPAQIKEPAAPLGVRFKINPQTCLISGISDKDGARYSSTKRDILNEYIKCQNNATRSCQKYLERLIPVAAYEGVTLGLENVWNNLWIQPDQTAALIDWFDSPWIRAWFDLGNSLKYETTENWLKTLGAARIVKLHIKDFKLEQGNKDGGRFVPIGYGDLDFISIRNVLEEIGLSGWCSLEDVPNFYDLRQHSKILDLFFSGQKIPAEKSVR